MKKVTEILFNPKLHYLGVIFFSVFAFLFIDFIVDEENQRFKEEQIFETKTHSIYLKSEIERILEERLKLAKSLEAIVLSHDYDLKHLKSEYQKYASSFFNLSSDLKSLQLAPNGIVDLVYPLKDNEKMIGYSLFEEDVNKDLILDSAQNNKYYVFGPIDFIQGGRGLIARLPIYKGDPKTLDNFWGFATVLIDSSNLISEINNLNYLNNHNFSLRNVNTNNREIIYGNPDLFKFENIFDVVSVGDTKWELAVFPTNGWPIESPISYYIWLIGILFIISMDTFLLMLISRPSELKREIQKATTNIQRNLKIIDKERQENLNLARQLEVFKLATSNTYDHVVITDQEGVIIYANDSVERITGFKPAEILGKKAGSRELWGGQMSIQFYKEMWYCIKEDKKPFVGEITNKRKNGEKYTALASISPVLVDGKVKYFVGIERDITKEKEIDRAKTEFVSIASHQLKTPLSAVNWYTELLLDKDTGKLNSKQKEYLNEIIIGNKKMVDLVDMFLNMTRLNLGTFKLESKDVDVVKVVKNVIKHISFEAKKKKIKIKNNLSRKKINIRSDEEVIQIIVQNLLSNSIKYTPINGQIMINVIDEKDRLVIKVEDNGIGIPENQKDKIFTRLFRADNAIEKENNGSGLGLYVIKSILDKVGGTIEFKSEIEKGTEFIVVLPK